MTNQSPLAPDLQKQGTRQLGRMFAAAFVAVLVLFLWLHLILALQIQNTGRQIQAKTAELEEVKRRTVAVESDIATSLSEQSLADRARDKGYEPKTPVFLLLPGPLAPLTSETGEADAHLADASASGRSAFQTLALWASLAQRLHSAVQTETGRNP